MLINRNSILILLTCVALSSALADTPQRAIATTTSSQHYVPLQLAATKKAPEVLFYSASWCGICRRARNYFNANQIPFTEYDVEKTQKGRDDFRFYQGRGVPLIFVEGQRMDGFSEARFVQLYQRVQR